MSGQKATRASRAEWAVRVEQWAASGQPAKAFGAEIGVNGRTLTYWKWLLRKESRGEPRSWPGRKEKRKAGAMPSFVEVRTVASDSRLVVELVGGRRLLVPNEFDADGLRRLLTILESP